MFIKVSVILFKRSNAKAKKNDNSLKSEQIHHLYKYSFSINNQVYVVHICMVTGEYEAQSPSFLIFY